MEKLRKSRKSLRSSVTRTVNEIEAELAKGDRKNDQLILKLNKVVDLMKQVTEHDNSIRSAMIDADCTDEELDEENISIEEYVDKVAAVKFKVDEVLKPSQQASTSSSQVHVAAAAPEQMKPYKLPKFELKTFDGETKNWLSFWSQFKRIHEDPKLHTIDKFQYLIQSTVEGTKARRLVESYAMTEENYPNAVKDLKDNCGNDTILLEYYVKEMVKMQSSLEKGMSLEDIVTKFVSHLRSLESLGLKQEKESVYLYSMFESLLPLEVIRAWQRSPLSGYEEEGQVAAVDRLDNLVKFTQMEVRREQRLALIQDSPTSLSVKEKKSDSAKYQMKSVGKRSQSSEDIPTAANLHIGQVSCIFCDLSHLSQNCPKVFDMTLEDKKAVIREKRVCFCCLRPGHMANMCKVFVKCTGCSKRHQHILCPEAAMHQKVKKTPAAMESAPAAKAPVVEEKTVNTNQVSTRKRVVLLQTIKVKAGGYSKRIIRMILDDGSQRSYIKTSVAKYLKCKSVRTFIEQATGFGGIPTPSKKRNDYYVPLQSLCGTVRHDLILAEAEKITGNIPSVPEGPWLKELEERNIILSDMETDCEDGDVDILIGMDLLREVLTGRFVMLESGLMAKETIFGWTVGGVLPGEAEVTLAMTITTMQLSDTNCSQLWDLEVLGIQDPAEVLTKKEKDEEVKQHFLNTVTRNEDGRYCVSLPWIGEMQKIPSNRPIAEKRLQSTTQKLRKDCMTEPYGKIFSSWEEESFIEEVREDTPMESGCHYLPHRAVHKPESKTTPVRPVFDASCKVGRNPSLNDCLEKGPNFIELIPTIMHRFREGRIGVISDIRKAFQMIEVSDRDKDFLRFLWWEDQDCKKIKVFRHNRVVFGVNCSPFLLGAVLEYHLSAVHTDDKVIAEKLMKGLYVDNCVTSVQSIEEYRNFKEDSTRILSDAKMDLREWEFGSSSVSGSCLLEGDKDTVESSGIGSSISDGCGLDAGSVKVVRETSVLGMKWDLDKDTLRCDTVPEVPAAFTKRSLLSIMQKVFDPMGFLSPAMIIPKLAMQEAWCQRVNWDEELPEDTIYKIRKWVEELKFLEEIRIPRNMNDAHDVRKFYQLHMFSDASQNAYAAVIFLRVVIGERISVQLLQSKARVAPLKKSTIPRLELLGCTIGARLCESVKVSMDLKVPTFYWTNSSTALAWIRRNDKWGTFVGNRVREICRLSSPQDCRHVPGICNPADLPSRGCTPKELMTSRWWEGPPWLRSPQDQWPMEEMKVDEEAVVAEKKKSLLVTVVNVKTEVEDDPWYSKRSSYATIVKVLAYVKRFVIRTRRQHVYQSKQLTLEEVEVAERTLFKVIQEENFPTGATGICGIHVQSVQLRRKIMNQESATFMIMMSCWLVLIVCLFCIVFLLVLWDIRL